MSIREYKKDHLKDHFELKLVEPSTPAQSNDLLKFWTEHSDETRATLVDLNIFHSGQKEKLSNGAWAGPFTGRPELIRQLAPIIRSDVTGLRESSVHHYKNTLRVWWRLLDAFESYLSKNGTACTRLTDVRQLSRAHYEFALRCGTTEGTFRVFIRIVNAALVNLAAPKLYWPIPRRADTTRELPPRDQIEAIRTCLKQEWERTLRRLNQMDRIKAPGFVPATQEEIQLLPHWHFLQKKQKDFNKYVLTTEELTDEVVTNRFKRKTGISILVAREIAYPTLWDVDTAFHLCLAHTGWNPATLYSLDSEKPFLRPHPKDPDRYLLEGIKERAGGKEQLIHGLWKTKYGPGSIIRSWLARTSPLREQLRLQLALAVKEYEALAAAGSDQDDIDDQFKTIQHLQTGTRNVWLFVGRNGDIGWLTSADCRPHSLNGRATSYLRVFLHRLNHERQQQGRPQIAEVTASDFRDMFALYVFRQSGGNLISVMKALNHSQVATTQRYLDNNVLNAERDAQARKFVGHLFNELSAGKLDITILAHLMQYGEVNGELQERLEHYRALQRSRVGLGCLNPAAPPSSIRADITGKICTSQRCLLCKSNAIILPESMPGVAMRVEELLATQAAIPLEAWGNTDLPEELMNGIAILALFPQDNVVAERAKWSALIRAGEHHIPGIHEQLGLAKVL